MYPSTFSRSEKGCSHNLGMSFKGNFTVVKVWNEMEQRLHIGPPEPGSDREKEFNDGVQQTKNRIQSIIDRRRNGEEQDDIPFIDMLLQSGVPDEQVNHLNYYQFLVQTVEVLYADFYLSCLLNTTPP